MKGACRVTVMTVGDRGGYAPTPYILWGQLPPLSPNPPAPLPMIPQGEIYLLLTLAYQLAYQL